MKHIISNCHARIHDGSIFFYHRISTAILLAIINAHYKMALSNILLLVFLLLDQ